MDYRLVPYIKKYLHEGHSLAQIRQSLLSQGVSDADIKQAAIYAMDEGTKDIKKKSVAIWIVPIILILLIGGAGYYFKDPITLLATDTMARFSGAANQQNNQATNEEQQTNQPSNQEQQNIQGTQQNIQGTCDMDCLIAAAETCNSANTEFESELDFFGMIISSKNYYEIKTGQKCELYMKIIDGNIEFSQELREQSLANGITEEELNLQLQESRKSIKTTVGKEGICVFDDNAKLKEFLEKTKAGTFSGSATCKMAGDCSIIVNGNTTTYSEGCDDLSWECTYTGDYALGKCTGSMFSG